jgi:uncharacterized phage-associated protein
MPYPAKAVANEFIMISKARNNLFTPMKLQKLVYFAHGWCLALTDKPLISGRIEAWQYGPVIPAIYHEFKGLGNGLIESPVTEIRYAGSGKFCRHVLSLNDYPDDEERLHAKEIIVKVFEIYGGYSAVKLSNATHMDGTPWQQVYKDGVRSAVIPDEKIETYFKAQVHARA